MSKRASSKKDYEVGYGKPPSSTRFAKGQSGNPSGRPKGSVSFVTDLEAELGTEVTVTENGKLAKLTKQRLFVKSVLSRAVKGDRHAADQMIGLIVRTIGLTKDGTRDEAPLSVDDEEVLEAFKMELARSLGGHDE